MQLFGDLRKRNVRVRVLTNSLESTTVLVAHSGYMHYRLPLLEEGVELYEVRSLLGNARGSGQTAQMSRYGNYSLHAKLFVFDRQRLFIGSMNFDQRSMHLNTEIGLIIDSPELAQQTAARFEAMVSPPNSYELALLPRDAGGSPRLVWRTEEDGKAVEYDTEPARSDGQRLEGQTPVAAAAGCRAVTFRSSRVLALGLVLGLTIAPVARCRIIGKWCSRKSTTCSGISANPDANSGATATGTTPGLRKRMCAASTISWKAWT